MNLIKENEKRNPSNYSANLIKNTTKEFSSLLDKQEHDWIYNYAQNNLQRYAFDFDTILNNIPGQSSICEIGAAPFFFSCVLKNAGYKVSAVDIAPERFKKIHELGVEIKKANIDHDILSFENNSFDAVVINEIFEHLKGNLIFTFQEIHRILKPEGILVLSTPNLKSIKGILNFLLKSKAYASANSIYEEWAKINKSGHMGHVREYTSREIIDFLDALDFKVIKLIHRGKNNTKTIKNKIIRFAERIYYPGRPKITIIAIKMNN